MGTPCITRFFDEDGEQICSLYRNYDGYLSGHGQDLANFLLGFEVGQGIPCVTPDRFANGMNCLAAQAVAHFKVESGNFYLWPPMPDDEVDEYLYDVKIDEKGEITVSYFEPNSISFTGSAAEFIKFINVEYSSKE